MHPGVTSKDASLKKYTQQRHRQRMKKAQDATARDDRKINLVKIKLILERRKLRMQKGAGMRVQNLRIPARRLKTPLFSFRSSQSKSADLDRETGDLTRDVGMRGSGEGAGAASVEDLHVSVIIPCLSCLNNELFSSFPLCLRETRSSCQGMA